MWNYLKSAWLEAELYVLEWWSDVLAIWLNEVNQGMERIEQGIIVSEGFDIIGGNIGGEPEIIYPLDLAEKQGVQHHPNCVGHTENAFGCRVKEL